MLFESVTFHTLLTCDYLPPALIQVRGNHVPHGSSGASEILREGKPFWSYFQDPSRERKKSLLGNSFTLPLRKPPCEFLLSLYIKKKKNLRVEVGGGRQYTLSQPQDRSRHTLWKSSLVQRVQSGCGQNLESISAVCLSSSCLAANICLG